MTSAGVLLALLALSHVALAQNSGAEEGLSPGTQARPIVGAIRWDAWHGDLGEPGKAVQRSLGPKHWHYRLPFFAKVLSDTEVEINGASQDVVDQEIAYASAAGLDYWAFVTYEPDSPMSLGLKYYLSSPRKKEINFCLITECARWGGKGSYREKLQRFVSLMSEASYQKVLGERPLIYIGFIRDEYIQRQWGSLDQFRRIVDEFRATAQRAGLGNPYIVVMDFSPQRGKSLADALGCDAISAYAVNGGGQAAPYSELARYAESFWDRCKATGAKVVPTVMAGWDRRPRVEHPVPWETWQQPGVGIEKYYQAPTPPELAEHLQRGLQWVERNPNAAPARALIVYAWNENDEGGWLVPTLSEGMARLDAIRGVLRYAGDYGTSAKH